jgi:hypothetical protein
MDWRKLKKVVKGSWPEGDWLLCIEQLLWPGRNDKALLGAGTAKAE